VKVSEISFGAWITFGNQLDDNQAFSINSCRFEHGVNYFDNADVYADGKAEIMMGKAIRDIPREELVISSKVFNPVSRSPNGRGLSRKHITEALHQSSKGCSWTTLIFTFATAMIPTRPSKK